jgi:hypothetical protein
MQLLNCGNQWNRRFQYRAKNPMQLQLPGFEREADSPKLLKTITTQRMEFSEGVDVLAKQDTVWNSWERWNHRAFCGQGESTCLPSRCAVQVESACNIVCVLGIEASEPCDWALRARPYPGRISLSLADSPNAPNPQARPRAARHPLSHRAASSIPRFPSSSPQ